jgi:hypothetical protein
MRDERAAVRWYRSRIHQKQREASALTIEVGLSAQDREDPGALSETMHCLETAVEILRRAREIREEQPGSGSAAPAEELMEDLGHSMAPLEMEAAGRMLHSPYERTGLEDSLRFFD